MNMPYQKEGIPMLAGKGNFVFLTPLQGQALRVFGKISTLRVVFSQKTLHRLNTSLTWPAEHRNTGLKARNCLINKNQCSSHRQITERKRQLPDKSRKSLLIQTVKRLFFFLVFFHKRQKKQF